MSILKDFKHEFKDLPLRKLHKFYRYWNLKAFKVLKKFLQESNKYLKRKLKIKAFLEESYKKEWKISRF